MLRVEPELIAAYVSDGTLRLAFHHWMDGSSATLLAHSAAECAGAQQPPAFWQMHDLIFARQGDLWGATGEVYSAMAGELGLEAAAFNQCMADPAIADKLARMDGERRSMNLRGRPSFLINDQLVEGAAPLAALAAVIDAAR